jgi:hypothetical protein
MKRNLFTGMGGYQRARAETETWFSPPAIPCRLVILRELQRA